MRALKRLLSIVVLLALVAPVAPIQAQEPPMRADLINLEHLRFLTEPVAIDGRDAAIVHIYSEYPDYEWVDAAGEGIAAVDDVARAAIVYLWYYERTGDGRALDTARRCLEFVRALQNDDGTFHNFVYDREGTINTEGITSYKSLGWWAMRGLWALAEGYRVFSAVDPAYAAELQAAYRLTESALIDSFLNYGTFSQVHGFSIPAWLPGGAADVSGLALVALTSYYRADPNPQTAAGIEHIADGLAAYRLGDSMTYPFGMIPVTTNAPGYWHAWGSHMVHGLADAGAALDRQDWIDAAAAVADTFLMRQMAFERVREMGILPRRLGQIAYGTNMLVQDLMALYRATGEERYATLAGLAASWFFGNNIAGVPMYDPDTGRGFDGINGPVAWRVNRNAGAESTIEALLALLTVSAEPLAARAMQASEVSVRPYRVVEAEAGKVAAGRPDYRSREWTGESYFSGSGYFSLGAGDALDVAFDVPLSGEYWIYASHERQSVSTPETTLVALRVPDGAVMIDGVLDEWADVPPFAADTARQILRGAALWRGPQIDSFTVRFMWDDDALYLAAEVRDPAHQQDEVGPGVWRQDALWGYLDGSGRGTRLNSKFTLAQTPQGPQVWDWVAESFMPNAELAWQPFESGDGYVYEARLPFRSMRVGDVRSGQVMRVEVGRGFGGDSFLDLTGADPDTPANLARLILVDDLADLEAYGGADDVLSAAANTVALGVALNGGPVWVIPANTAEDRRYLWLDLVSPEPVMLDAGAHTLTVTYAGRDDRRRASIDGFLIQPVVAERVFETPDGTRFTLTYDTHSGAVTLVEEQPE